MKMAMMPNMWGRLLCASQPSALGLSLRLRGCGHGGSAEWHRDRVDAPGDEHHDHHRDQLHDLQSFFAGLANPLGVLPPEIESDGDGKARGNKTDCSGSERATKVKILQEFIDQSRKIPA